MWTTNAEEDVIAILLADIHLSLKPPVWRSAEPDWLEAQKRPLLEVQTLKGKYGCPVIGAGDIFDRWNSPPELINFALTYLPDMFSIPGQHDLPLHNYDDIRKSAFWTLVEAGRIHNILPGCHNVKWIENDIILVGFPFGFEIEPLQKKEKGKIYLAVVHDYVWIRDCGYPGAPKENEIRNTRKEWVGYDVIQYGDNHRGFSVEYDSKMVYNCGTLMRRKSDEEDYHPGVGLLMSSGKVVQHFLDTSEDKHLDIGSVEVEEEALDMADFIEGLEKLGDTALDFTEAMKQFLKKEKPSMEVRDIILKAMGC